LHEQDEILNYASANLPTASGSRIFKEMSICFGLIGLVCYGISFMVPDAPFVKRTYPYDGLRQEFGAVGSELGVERPVSKDV
jgi:NADH dehydrogenase (ubiquinone) 1 beta subcomplex subunit 8